VETCKEPPKRLSIIVKPTHDCNMGCEYCYIDPEAEQGVMDEGTLENMVNKSMSTHDSVHFIWHGGEPLLLPLSFYRKAVEFQKQFEGKGVSNGFQTNGTLVTKEVLDFCEENQFSMGFSLDGPKHINDETRHFKDGSSSYLKTLRAIKRAQKRKVGGGAIVVVNKTNVDRLPEIYEFAQRQGINLKLNPLIKAGSALDSMEDLGIGPLEYGRALVDLFDRWFYDDSSVRVDPFEDLMGNLLTGKPWGCNYSESCQNSFISVGPQGDIYPCGRFDGVPGFHLGNVNEGDLADVLTSEKRLHLRGRAERIEPCQPCEHKDICNSGCMHNAYMRRGRVDDRDYYCASFKLLFDHINEAMDAELANAEVK